MTASEATELPLSSIRRDGGTQPRAELHEEWAQEYAEDMAEGASLPPVVVFYDGTNNWLADGFHRCRAAEIAEQNSINAEVVSGTRREAVLYSVSANGNHGHRRTNADKRRAVDTLLRDNEWSAWSDREIARQCGVSPDTVNRYRRDYLSESDRCDKPDTRTVRRGDTVYQQNTSNIGQQQTEAPEQEQYQSTPDNTLEPEPEPEQANEPVQKHVHVSANSGNNEWYTPSEYIELARSAMGSIDTDPATSQFANQTVKAPLYFTAEDDGRAQTWRGNVWLNPPYSQPLMSEFSGAVASKYLNGEIRQACVLVNNATETEWFQKLMQSASAVAFLRGRIRYLDSEGNPANTPLQGQAVVYLGAQVEQFRHHFGEKGRVLING